MVVIDFIRHFTADATLGHELVSVRRDIDRLEGEYITRAILWSGAGVGGTA